MNGGVEAPSSAQEIIDKFLAEELAAIEPKTATPAAADAVPPAKPEPTQEEVDAYLEKLEKDRKGVSPFGYDKAQVERAEDEMQANNRIAGRSKEDPLIVLPEEGKIDGADPSLSLGVADPGEDGEDLKTNMDAAVDDLGVTTSLPLPTIEPSSIIETGKKSRKKKSVPSSAPAAPDVTGSTAQVGEPDPKPVSSEAGRFKLPKIKKGESIKLRAPDGTVHTLAHKASGYWISKEGDSKEASIALSSARQHAKDGGWVLLKEGSGVVGAEPDAQAPSPDAAAATPKADPIEPDAATTVPQAEPFPQPPVVPQAEPLLTPEPLPILKGEDIAAALVLLDAGSNLAYRRADGTEIRVEKKADGQYWVSEKDDSGFVTVGAAGLEEMGEREGWQSVEALPSLGAQGEAKPDVAEQDAKIAKLREAVTAARTAFITAEESQGSTWKKLMQTFRTLKHRESDDHDIRAYHNAYDQAVLALQEAELEKLKQSGLSLQQLRPEMAALIRESQFDEAERIYAERRQQRREKTNQSLGEKLDARWKETIGSLEAEAGKGEEWKQYIKYAIGMSADMGGKVIEGIEKGGAAYNEFARTKKGKLLLGMLVAAGVAGAATGGLVAPAAGLLLLKRWVAGAGLAVTIERSTEKVAEMRREKKRKNVETDQAGFFQKMEDAVETKAVEAIATGKEGDGKLDLSLLEAFLKDEAAKARRGEGARRRNALLRKSGAIFAGVVLGSGAASHFAHGFFVDKADAVSVPAAAVSESGSDAAAPPSGAAPVVEQTRAGAVAGGPTGGEVTSNPSVSPATEVPGAVATAVPAGQSVEVSPKAKDFLSTHEVKRGDNIWKLAKSVVQDVPDMDRRASDRFAKLVELKLQAKLDASPDMARAAGFVAGPDGKFSPSYIQAGAKLEIGKLISADEMSKLIEEAKGSAPIEVAAPTGPSADVSSGKDGGITPDTVSKPAGGRDIYPRLVKAFEESQAASEAGRLESVIVPDDAVDGVVELRPETELLSPTGNVMTYVESLPADAQKDIFRNFKHVSEQIFRTDEVMNTEGYDRNFNPISQTELAKAKLAVVLSNHDALAQNPLSSYDRVKNPLHWSQMETVAKLSKAAGKTFGTELARARTGESIQEYVLRVVALAGHEGKKIPGFRMLN